MQSQLKEEEPEKVHTTGLSTLSYLTSQIISPQEGCMGLFMTLFRHLQSEASLRSASMLDSVQKTRKLSAQKSS